MRFPRPAPAGALLTLTLVVPTVIVGPTVTFSRPTPHPVAAEVHTVALSGVDSQSLRAAPTPGDVTAARRSLGLADDKQPRPLVLTDPMTTDGYRMIGVTWRNAAPGPRSDVVVSARTRTDGEWTDWFMLDPMTDAGTQASPNGRYGTAPYWAGDSDGIQVRVDAVGRAHPTDVRADLIEPGTSDADALITDPMSGAAAMASTNKPPIVTRAQWGADESLRDKHMENNRTIQVAFVHHTAGSNSYSRSESPAVVRGLYSYYVNTLKYADMGYNFLVDKYGTIYEGRAGSITKPVRSAATGGFNTNSMAVVAMGNFQTAPASDAMVQGIAKVLAYRLSRYHRDPFGTKVLTAEVGSSKYSPGQKATFKVISGHRDAGYTACPGNHLYKRLPTIRRLAAKYMSSSLIKPTISSHVSALGKNVNFHVHSRVTQQQGWTVTVRDFCTGELVRRIHGQASPGNPISASWLGKTDGGSLAPPGRYRLTLTSSGSGTTAWPWRTSVVTGVGGDARAPTTDALPTPASGTYVPIEPHTLVSTADGVGVKHRMLLGAGRRLDVHVLGRAGVPSSGVSAVALSVQAVCASKATRLWVGPDSVSGAGARAVSLGSHGTARGFVLVRVGPHGGVRFQNSAGATGVQASVVGYVSTNGGGGALTPLRRHPLHVATPLKVDNSAKVVDIAGHGGVPADARAVVLTLRRSADSPVGSVWAWPSDKAKPGAPTWRRPRGTGSIAQAVVPLGGNGNIKVAADRGGHVSFDVAGYVARGDTRGFHPLVPKTLTGSGTRLGKGDAKTIKVKGRARVPSRAKAVVVQLSGSRGKGAGRLTLWPRGSAEPRTADLAVPKRLARDTFAVVRLGKGGDVRLRAHDSALTADLSVVGWIN